MREQIQNNNESRDISYDFGRILIVMISIQPFENGAVLVAACCSSSSKCLVFFVFFLVLCCTFSDNTLYTKDLPSQHVYWAAERISVDTPCTLTQKKITFVVLGNHANGSGSIAYLQDQLIALQTYTTAQRETPIPRQVEEEMLWMQGRCQTESKEEEIQTFSSIDGDGECEFPGE